MEASGDGPINYEEWNMWIDWMKAHKISWITWSVTDKNETCSMLLPSAASGGNWKESDLKESGVKTRELLREFAGNKK
jgi:endoglucanase